MPADAVLMIVLAALAIAAAPMLVWLRAQKRIKHLEMTLLAQTTDADRYDELRALLDRIAAQTEQLADMQAQLAGRLAVPVEQLPPPRMEPMRPITPH